MKMALTNPNFYWKVLLLVSVIALALTNFSVEVYNDPTKTLDNKSIDYIRSFTTALNGSQIQSLSNQNVKSLEEQDIILDANGTGSQSSTDQLANLNYDRERGQRTTNLFKIIYNIPSFIVVGLGFPLGDFKPYLNALAWILVAALIYLGMKMLKGLA